MSSFPNHIAASVAPAAFNAERVAARQVATRQAREARAADALDLATQQLEGAAAAGEAAEELPDPPTPGYELLYTKGHGHHHDDDQADEASPTVVVVEDTRQIDLPFHHIDVRA